MIFAESFAQDPATPITLTSGLALFVLKWVFMDIRNQKKEDNSRVIREDNLVMQTELLRRLVKQRKKENKTNKNLHKETHKLLEQLANRKNETAH